jgi:CheY-like chemotaxis protein
MQNTHRRAPKPHHRVLVVDDHQDSRTVARIVLEHEGVEVMEAADGVEGVRKALEFLPDVVLMDIVLPEIDGLNAARQIRLHPQTGPMRIVALTAIVREGIAEEALIAGCNAFLPKPYHIATLRNVVAAQIAAANGSQLRTVLHDFVTYARASIRYRTTKGQYHQL